MAALLLTGTVTDTIGATANDTLTVTSTTAAPLRVVTRSLLYNRNNWGSAIDYSIQGPKFSNTEAEPNINDFSGPPTPATLGQCFKVEIACRFTGCRIYKAPTAVATDFNISLWTGVTTGIQAFATPITVVEAPEELATMTADWVSDDGGWRQFTFPTPVDLEPGIMYTCGYYAPLGVYAWSPWVWHAQDTVVWPINAEGMTENPRGKGTAIHDGEYAFPDRHFASAYYIDVQVEWDDRTPGYSHGREYFDQWTAPFSRFPFMVAMFFSDPENLAGYWDRGINTLFAGTPGLTLPNGPQYVAAMNAIDNQMDWWPSIRPLKPDVFQALEDPAIDASICGYLLDDEPDMSTPYNSPTEVRSWANYVKQRDSTRPLHLGFGMWTVHNQGFAHSPPGSSMMTANQLWREWAAIADTLSVDDYTLSSGYDTYNRFGIWTYPVQIRKMRELCDDRLPVWVDVETTSQTPGQPIPSDTYKAIWAGLIAGARGVLLFDHRFASDLVTQDFAAMLSDEAMSDMISALSARLQLLGEALWGPELDLVTAWTTSNMTSGPKGGEYGVPMHFTTREDSSHEYLFAMGIRPGATTATFTIPSWAGETLTVLDESRTVTVSGGGVLTDTFAEHYTVHLYQKT